VNHTSSQKGIPRFRFHAKCSSLSKGSWRQNPLSADKHIPLSIRNFLEIYGFAIPLDPAMEKFANRVIWSKGAYYAYGRGGSLIVVAPREKVIIFAYAG
jgi:hypothetical protein